MADLFSDDDRYTALLARLEALEAAVFPKAARPAKESVGDPLLAAWQRWEAYRKGKKWTAEARTLNMRKLRALAGEDGEMALAIVQQSIEFGYQGLFPLKAPQNGPQATQQPVKHKTKAQALAPTEDKRTAHLAWCWNQVERGMMTEDEFHAEAEKARGRIA